MYKQLLFFTMLLFSTGSIAQSPTLITYPADNYAGIKKDNPPVFPIGTCAADDPLFKKVGQNTDFKVWVKKTSEPDTAYRALFVHSTFVNSSSGDLGGVTRSSFVTFDYSEEVKLKIECTAYGTQSSVSGKVKIRPLSRQLTPVVTNNNTFVVTLAPRANDPYNNKSISDKLSIELNDDRYRNLHIFANRIEALTPPTGTVIVYDKAGNGTNLNIYQKSVHDNSNKKIIIKEGAVVIVPFSLSDVYHNSANIKLNNGDEIFIEGGGILKGGITATDANGIKISGRGIIDLTNFQKQNGHDNVDPDDNINRYHYNNAITLENCKNVTIDGIIINDPQQLCIGLKNCGGTSSDPIDNIKINNVKMFSRVANGDGIHMEGTMNVSINDCFSRTSDDCIAIYASRMSDTANRDALNIAVTNSALYADNSHPINIGWHGNGNTGSSGNNIYNLNFNNIDILEHDEKAVDMDGFVHTEYDGAISIACADGNKCDNFVFNNIRIEDFTSGSILCVRVVPQGVADAITNGKYAQNIKFQNISYNGSGERKSIIQGINCDRFVNGVHFENFKINNQLITKLSDYILPSGPLTTVPRTNPLQYSTAGFDTNAFAYNITFEEGNNYSLSLGDGDYTIENARTANVFLQTITAPDYVIGNAGTSRVWRIQQTAPDSGIYTISPVADPEVTPTTRLTNSIFSFPTDNCQGRYVTNDAITSNANQLWKIVPDGTTGNYHIINAYSRSYLTHLPGTENIRTVPKSFSNTQQWKLAQVLYKARNTKLNLDKETQEHGIKIFPNPTNEFLNINNLEKNSRSVIEIIDLNGKKLSTKELYDKQAAIYVGNLSSGIYFVKISNGEAVVCEKFIKK